MPYKNPERARAYWRDYRRKARATKKAEAGQQPTQPEPVQPPQPDPQPPTRLLERPSAEVVREMVRAEVAKAPVPSAPQPQQPSVPAPRPLRTAFLIR